jgi:hypothetical protein
MGGGNPIKQVVDRAIEGAHQPARYISERLGLQGVADVATSLEGFEKGLSDKAFGEDKKKAEAKRKGEEEADALIEGENKKRSLAAGEAAFEASEKERMGAGGGARTLLTGPKGLEDDENMTISRRTLTGR